MKGIRYILGIAFLSIALGIQAQTTLAPPTISFVDSTEGEVTLQWQPVAGLSYSITKTDVATYGGTTHNTTITIPVSDNEYGEYIDNLVNGCDEYLYSVTATLTKYVSGKQVIEQSPPSNTVTAHVSGFTFFTDHNGFQPFVVIYPVAETTAVVGTLFIDTIHACDATDVPLRFSVSSNDGSPAPKGMTIDSITGTLTWQVPATGIDETNCHNVIVLVREAKPYGEFTSLNLDSIRIKLQGAGSFAGGVNITGDKNATTVLECVNTTTYATETNTLPTGGGAFSFQGLAPGTYKLFVNSLEYPASQLWYPTGSTYNTAGTITIQAGASFSLPEISLSLPSPSPVIINGFMKDSAGYGIPNGTIQAFETDGFFTGQGAGESHIFANAPMIFAGGSAQTGSDGSYSLQLNSGKSYILLASASGYASQFIGVPYAVKPPAPSPFNAPAFMPSSENQFTDTLNSTGTSAQIIGTVTSSQTNSMGVQAMVILSEVKPGAGPITGGNSGGIVPFGTVSSDSAGNFVISSFTPDTAIGAQYIIQAIPYTGYIPSYFAYGDTTGEYFSTYQDSLFNNLLWDYSERFSIGKDSTVHVNISVPPLMQGGGTISGAVQEFSLSSGYNPANRAFVYALNDSLTAPAGFAITDDKGNYVISNLPMGTYTVIADKLNYASTPTDGIALTVKTIEQDSVDLELDLIDTTTIAVKEPGNTGSALTSVQLIQNYPNPFASSTVIGVNIPQNVDVQLATLGIYDELGRKVSDLSASMRTNLRGNTRYVTFSAGNLPQGVYYCRMSDAKGATVEEPMIFIR